MADPSGFRRFTRAEPPVQPAAIRRRHWQEFTGIFSEKESMRQATRCMDCGTPFCQSGCPVHNQIPDWNDLVLRRDWRRAIGALHSTNNFPEITGRICPAPCEEACTLNLGHAPVAIKGIELTIAEHAWREDWVVPEPAGSGTGKRCAIVGSGPAGLACAQQLTRVGHAVTVFEKQDRIGGLLRYGIPDFRLDKRVLDRRLDQMRAEGVTFRAGACVGETLSAGGLRDAFDAVVLACGAEQPRDLNVPGRNLAGIHFAMDYLRQQNRRMAGDAIRPENAILATDRDVVVIGGGDTGADCIGTANRQGARSVTQIQYHARPPEEVDRLTTWPRWPHRLRTSQSHEEGCTRLWELETIAFRGINGHVQELELAELRWRPGRDGALLKQRVPGDRQILTAGLVLLAMGYAGPRADGPVRAFHLVRDACGNVRADSERYRTSAGRVFACGDMRRGQSLVVWAIREGRQAARAVDQYLTGHTTLPYC